MILDINSNFGITPDLARVINLEDSRYHEIARAQSPTYKLDVSNVTQSLSFNATGGVSDSPMINTTGSIASNVTITSSGGSVIIQLG